MIEIKNRDTWNELGEEVSRSQFSGLLAGKSAVNFYQTDQQPTFSVKNYSRVSKNFQIFLAFFFNFLKENIIFGPIFDFYKV